MFDSKIVNLGFKWDTPNSMKLELKNIVFLYIIHGGVFYYEYYGKSDSFHSETDKDTFVRMIHDYKAKEREDKINEILHGY